jgi:hypothetical protein
LIDVLETVLALIVGDVKRIFKKVGGKKEIGPSRARAERQVSARQPWLATGSRIADR